MDKVTGQHPIYKHVYSTCVNGKYYGINTESGRVWECKFSPDIGTYNKVVTSKKIIQAVKAVVELTA